MKSLRLESFRLKNFKAVRDSGVIGFTPLTVFIGNNGSGKSSIIEGITTFRQITGNDLEEVMQGYHGYENIWHKGVPHKLLYPKKGGAREHYSEPMSFELLGRYKHGAYTAKMEIGLGPEGKELFISHEEATVGRAVKLIRDAHGRVKFTGKVPSKFGSIKFQRGTRMEDGVSIIGKIPYLDEMVSDWQFLYLDPGAMGQPAPEYRTIRGKSELLEDGANIAEYLQEIKDIDQPAFQGLVETIQYVLPYLRDLQPKLISGLDRTFILQMTEGEFEVPGWLLSTGTLRFLGILALLRHPNPPPLIIIEELENGLDPRTLSLIIDEMRNALEAGKTQIIVTTHSPYLLDLLDLSQIVLVERLNSQQPTFIRPDQESLKEWSKKFSPGQLYTMNALSRKDNA